MKKYLMFSAILLGSTVLVSSQQTIFNVPTTDVLDRGKIYFEIDASFKFNDQAALGCFSSFVPRIVAGVGATLRLV